MVATLPALGCLFVLSIAIVVCCFVAFSLLTHVPGLAGPVSAALGFGGVH